MTLLRAGARTLLASYFVVSGFKAVRNPAELVPVAQPLADKVVPLVKQYAPAQVAGYIPEDAQTLVRINGAAQLLGGIALATGKGRRVGATLLAASLVPSTLAKHPFWSRDDPEQRAIDKAHFLKNVSLLGGVVLAARDTEGKPGIAWRAHKVGHELSRSTGRTSSKVAKTTSALADTALAEGVALAGVVAATTRKARKAAAKQAGQARKTAEKAAVQARKDAQKFAKKAKKDAPKQLAAAKKEAAKRADELAKQVLAARKEAAKQAEIARKQAAKQLAGSRKDLGDAVADAKKSVGNAVSHIRLGEN